MRSPEAPTALINFSSGTPSNLLGSLYHGVLVTKDVMPSDSSIARSKRAFAPSFVLEIFPEIARIGFPAGWASVAAPAALAASHAKAPRIGTPISFRQDEFNMLRAPETTCSKV